MEQIKSKINLKENLKNLSTTIKVRVNKKAILNTLLSIIALISVILLWEFVAKPIYTFYFIEPTVTNNSNNDLFDITLIKSEWNTKTADNSTSIKVYFNFNNKSSTDMVFNLQNSLILVSRGGKVYYPNYTSYSNNSVTILALSNQDITVEYNYKKTDEPIVQIRLHDESKKLDKIINIESLKTSTVEVIDQSTNNQSIDTTSPSAKLSSDSLTKEKASLINIVKEFLNKNKFQNIETPNSKIHLIAPEGTSSTYNDESKPNMGDGGYYYPSLNCFEINSKGEITNNKISCKSETITYNFYSEKRLISFNDSFTIYENLYPSQISGIIPYDAKSEEIMISTITINNKQVEVTKYKTYMFAKFELSPNRYLTISKYISSSQSDTEGVISSDQIFFKIIESITE